jgi:hypothetical protein
MQLPVNVILERVCLFGHQVMLLLERVCLFGHQVMLLLFVLKKARLFEWWLFSSSSSGTKIPLAVESYRLHNDIFPFPSTLNAGHPIFNLYLANILFDVILPSVLGSSL